MQISRLAIAQYLSNHIDYVKQVVVFALTKQSIFAYGICTTTTITKRTTKNMKGKIAWFRISSFASYSLFFILPFAPLSLSIFLSFRIYR